MTTVTMLDMRRDPVRIMRQVQCGRRMVLTYRGRPVMRLEPIGEAAAMEDDAFYRIADRAIQGGSSLSNTEMDETVYGPGSVR
jgi:antitoxin (DNA-binding transcriptional repressor) of toxin-antitoxin stability system